MLGGRGAGKTRLGAEWVRAMAHGIRPYADRRSLQIALVGETEHDVREVMIEGPAGLLQDLAASRAPGVDRLASPAGMAERRGRLHLFRGGSRAAARAAIRRRMV